MTQGKPEKCEHDAGTTWCKDELHLLKIAYPSCPHCKPEVKAEKYDVEIMNMIYCESDNPCTLQKPCSCCRGTYKLIEKALLAAEARGIEMGLERAAKVAEDSCLNDLLPIDKWRLACNKGQGKEPYIVADIENGYDEATYQIAKLIRQLKPSEQRRVE